MTELAESIYKDTTTFVGYTPAEKVKVTLQSTDKTFAFGGFAGGGTVLKCGCPFSSESAGKDYLDRKRQITQLTDTPEYENYPVYSPDGKRIAFISKNGKESEICIMNSDGTQRRTLVPQQWIVDDTVVDSYGGLVWSPDGKELAFTCIDLVVMVRVPGSGINLTWVVLIVGILAAGGLYLYRTWKHK